MSHNDENPPKSEIPSDNSSDNSSDNEEKPLQIQLDEPIGNTPDEPIGNTPVEPIGNTPVKASKRGRPKRDPFIPTELPNPSSVSAADFQQAKFRRSREVNNLASRRYRAKRKERELRMELEARELKQKNEALQRKILVLERLKAQMMTLVEGLNSSIDASLKRGQAS